MAMWNSGGVARPATAPRAAAAPRHHIHLMQRTTATK